MTARKVKAAILSGDRRALARAITLVESTRAADREKAESLLAELLPHAGKAMRLGISGVLFAALIFGFPCLAVAADAPPTDVVQIDHAKVDAAFAKGMPPRRRAKNALHYVHSPIMYSRPTSVRQ